MRAADCVSWQLGNRRNEAMADGGRCRTSTYYLLVLYITAGIMELSGESPDSTAPGLAGRVTRVPTLGQQ